MVYTLKESQQVYTVSVSAAYVCFGQRVTTQWECCQLVSGKQSVEVRLSLHAWLSGISNEDRRVSKKSLKLSPREIDRDFF